MKLSAISGAQAAQAFMGHRSTVTLGLALFMTVMLMRSIVVTGLGDHLAQTDPQAALRLGRDSPEVLASTAYLAWEAGAGRPTLRFATAALDRSPLNVFAMRMDAQGLKSAGKSDQAERLVRFAGTRSWRDDGVQVWLMRESVSRHDFDDAYHHADALARQRSEIWPTLFLMFDDAVADDAASRSLCGRLAGRPDWRTSFLESLAMSLQPDAVVDRLFQAVDKGPAPLVGVELSFYPLRLAREGRRQDALAALKAYRNGLTPDGLAMGRRLGS